MTTLEALRPTEKLTVYRVLEALNFDLTDWERDQDGNPIDNPAINGRAFAWSYHDAASEQDVFMLWHAEMAERDGQIVYRQGWNGFLRELEETRPQTAARIPKPRKWRDVLLDSEPWHLSLWEPLSNTFEFTRGLPRAAESTPNDVPPVDEPDLSLLADIKRFTGRWQPDGKSGWLPRDWGRADSKRGAGALGASLRGVRRDDAASHSCSRTASHGESGTNAQRLDPAQRTAFGGDLDALFDVGLITFGEDGGSACPSPHLADTAIPVEGLRLRRPLDAEEAVYMDFHRTEIFKAE
ncbi:MAG: hypothetical protein IPO08_19020 [Xanthomonadales bacterium]|nr:hypothetical protein [Xanthomonadales bacterium]